jgi:hypothetical protein
MNVTCDMSTRSGFLSMRRLFRMEFPARSSPDGSRVVETPRERRVVITITSVWTRELGTLAAEIGLNAGANCHTLLSPCALLPAGSVRVAERRISSGDTSGESASGHQYNRD